jgi:hypothetical protein
VRPQIALGLERRIDQALALRLLGTSRRLEHDGDPFQGWVNRLE